MTSPLSLRITLSLASMLLVSCSQAEAPAQAALPDADAQVIGCEPGQARPAPLGVVLNNQWNRQAAGPGPWRQCLQVREREGRSEFGWFWEWPGKDNIYAYPELLVGRSPWMATPTNDSRFPRRVGDTRSLQLAYEVESRTSGKKNLAAEFWFTSTPPAAGQQDIRSIKTELMIWTDAAPGIEDVVKVPTSTVEIDGMTWKVQVKPNWGDASGGVGNQWNLISYHAQRKSSNARYDARKFLDDAIARGLIAPDDYIWGVELGNEIISGSGSTWIKHFDMQVK